jgi:hypothetical protein
MAQAERVATKAEVFRDPRGELTKYLEFCAGVANRNSRLNGYAYRSVYEFLLKHGRFYEPCPLPERMWTGFPKCCFGNAIILGIKEDLRYVEGVAISCHGFPIDHRWNTTEDFLSIGQQSKPALDCTWEPVGLGYFGVEFSLERADDATRNGDASVLNDYQRRYPLFREPWHGEDYTKVWPRSPRLEHIRRTLEENARLTLKKAVGK